MNTNYDNLKNSLNLKEDDEGIIRSRVKIKNANVPYDTKEPTMLDSDHKLRELIIWHCHEIVTRITRNSSRISSDVLGYPK